MKRFVYRITRLAHTLDKKGLTKSADHFDQIITKVAQHDDDYDDLAAEWDRMEMEQGGLERLEEDLEREMEEPEVESLLQQMKDFLSSGKLDSVSSESKEELLMAVKALEGMLEGPQAAWGGFAMGKPPGEAVELPMAEASYLSQLVTIANRLDEKGMTKEADMIDKIAREVLEGDSSYMSVSGMRQVADQAAELAEMFSQLDNFKIEDWVENKIATIEDDLSEVYEYFKYNQEAPVPEKPEIL